MFKGTKAYLYQDSTVVLNKNDLKNAKEEDFKEVTLLLSADFIKNSYKELEVIEESDEEDF